MSKPPQLEVKTITNYDSDPQPVLGRQIAVNMSYICYGLKQGIIRVLNNHNGLKLKCRGHTQRVTDMTFFAEDVHLLASVSIEGRLFVWKFSEGLDEGGRPQITGNIVIAILIVDEEEAVHPRVCWHCSKQEVLFVGFGKRVLRIDTSKVAKGEVPSAEDPIKCPVQKLIDGVHFVGEHDGEVTDLSMCQWMTTRLVSASIDGTIKIWEDRKPQPLTVLRPYDGLPVYSAIFVTAPNKPDHIILITVGSLNQEVKIWSSATEVLTSDDELWKCTHTLELKSSAQPRVEDAIFDQVIALSQAGLLLLTNAKKNAIYAVHIDFGGEPAATRMDYIAEFTVTMPILSFTGTNISPHGEQIVQVYCVQTQAIQQYALDLSKCLPPPPEHSGSEKSDSTVSHHATEVMSTNSAPRPGKLSGLGSPTHSTHSRDQRVNEYLVDRETNTVDSNTVSHHELVDNSDLGNPKLDVNTAALQLKVMRDKMEQLERKQTELDTKLQERMTMREKAIYDIRERISKEDFPVLLDKMVKNEIAALRPAVVDEITKAIEQKNIMAISHRFQKLEQSVNSTIEAIQFNLRVCLSLLEEAREQSEKDVSGSATATTTSQPQTPKAKSRKQEWKNMQASGPSSCSPGVLDPAESFIDAVWSSRQPSLEAAVRQTMAVQARKKKLFESQNYRTSVATIFDKKKKEEAAVPQTMATQDMMNKSEVGDKAVTQWEELVNSKLNATIAQFQTSAKQVLEDALRSSMESTVVPYFMRKCKVAFDQVDAEFRKQIDIYSTAPRQPSAYSSLADALREAMSSLSSVTQTVSRKLADDQRNLADFSTKMQLSRLVSEHKYDEAFRSVLRGDDGGDIGLLSWLCTQVNLHDILKLDPINIPLRVSVIISLHARFRRHYNINHDASVLEWMSHLEDALEVGTHHT